MITCLYSYSGKDIPVCSEHWTEEWSDIVCYQLGYSGFLSREDKPKPESDFAIHLNNSFVASEQQLLQEAVYEGSENETCSEVVSLDCESFGKKKE